MSNLNQDEETKEKYERLKAPQAAPWNYEIIYSRTLVYGYLHLAGFYGLYLCATSAKWATILYGFVMYMVGMIGVTAGAHRLWAHKTYKATTPLQILLVIFFSTSGQYSVLDWVRYHRMHHKYSDTDADPHNSTRGLFFSHIGWQFVKIHPELKKRGPGIDISDIYNNLLLMFHYKYYIPINIIICFILPALIPILFWEESFNNAWHVNLSRFTILLNVVFCINSIAHYWGSKPYNKKILATRVLTLSFLTNGEGFHNYHHTFPWDYRTAELGNKWTNLTAHFIDFFAWIGWAYDLKTASKELVEKTMEQQGDGTTL